MRAAVLFALVLLGLPGCRYDSTADLRPSAKQYAPSAAFPVGESVFQTSDQSSLIVLSITDKTARASYQNQGGDPMAATLIAILGADILPPKTYVAMALGGKNKDKAQLYQYYPFRFGKTHLEWFKPSETTTVFGLTDLASNVVAQEKAGKPMSFSLVPPAQAAAVKQRFSDWRASKKAKAKATATASPPAITATEPSVKGFTVGDGVYVQGFLSDRPSMIQSIDEANRRVKILRYHDGISQWVSFDSILSRNESTVNDVARGGLAIGVIVCMMSPETCKPKPK